MYYNIYQLIMCIVHLASKQADLNTLVCCSLLPMLNRRREKNNITSAEMTLILYILIALSPIYRTCSSLCMLSGALGPTIQSSMANHSLQLFSAASISAMTGPCSGLMNGTVSSGNIS